MPAPPNDGPQTGWLVAIIAAAALNAAALITFLGNRLIAFRANKAAVAVAEIESHDNFTSALRLELDSVRVIVRSALDQLDTVRREAITLTEKVSHQNIEIERLQLQIDRLQDEKQRLMDEHAECVQTLTAQIADKDSRIERLSSQIANFTNIGAAEPAPPKRDP